MKKNFFVLTGLMATGLFTAAQIPTIAQQTPTSTPNMSIANRAMGNVPRPEAALLDVQDQSVPDGKFFVKQADAPGNGYLVVREDNGGQPGAVLGYVPLSAGANRNVIVPLRALPSSGMVIVSVHSPSRKVSNSGSFNFATHPLARGGNKSALSTVTILPNTTMPMVTPGS